MQKTQSEAAEKKNLFDPLSAKRREYDLFSNLLRERVIPDVVPANRPAQLKAIWEKRAMYWLNDERHLPSMLKQAQCSGLDPEMVRSALVWPQREGSSEMRFSAWDPNKASLGNFIRRCGHQAASRDLSKAISMTSLDAKLSEDGDRTLGDVLSSENVAESGSETSQAKEQRELHVWALELGFDVKEGTFNVLRHKAPYGPLFDAAAEKAHEELVARVAELSAPRERPAIQRCTNIYDAVAASSAVSGAFDLVKRGRATGIIAAHPNPAGKVCRFIATKDNEQEIDAISELIEAAEEARKKPTKDLASAERNDAVVLKALARSKAVIPQTPEQSQAYIAQRLYSVGLARHLDRRSKTQEEVSLSQFARVAFDGIDFSRNNAVLEIDRVLAAWSNPETRHMFAAQVRAGAVEIPKTHSSLRQPELFHYDTPRRQVEIENALIGRSTVELDCVPEQRSAQARILRLSNSDKLELVNFAKAHGIDAVALVEATPLHTVHAILANRDAEAAKRYINAAKVNPPAKVGEAQLAAYEPYFAAAAAAGAARVAQEKQYKAAALDKKPREQWTYSDSELADRNYARSREQFQQNLIRCGVRKRDLPARWEALQMATVLQPKAVERIEMALEGNKWLDTLTRLCQVADKETLRRIASGGTPEEITRAAEEVLAEAASRKPTLAAPMQEHAMEQEGFSFETAATAERHGGAMVR
ncbi:hypothetical protein DB347_17945 [Opitutaceae bacterium EW11]|nr:hypothetical protein DB347_17945 [Opitutaceae bacterium EW11]